MAPNKSFKCADCLKKVTSREFLACNVCNSIFHIECINYSEKLFALMSKEKKENWQCLACKRKNKPIISKQNISSSASPGQDSISTRPSKAKAKNKILNVSPKNKPPPDDVSLLQDVQDVPPKRLRRSLSVELPTDSSYSIFQSLESVSKSTEYVNDLDIVNGLKLKISKLQTDLKSCENELENTIIANNELKRQVAKLSQEINFLKNICKSPQRPKITTHNDSFNELESSRLQQILTLEETIAKLNLEVQTAHIEISRLNMTIEKLELEIHIKTTSETIYTEMKQEGSVHDSIAKYREGLRNHTSKNKICIISSDRKLNILQNIKTISPYNNFQILHHITNNVGIDIMLRDLDIKLKDYTKHDFCVVMIGATDFYLSQDFRAIVKRLKEKINSITNTNVIIIAPTYICGKPLYNYRVELFNNMLYNDIYSTDCSYLLDSNKYLTIDMFSLITGKIKKSGVKHILEKISDYISIIKLAKSRSDILDGVNNEEEMKELPESQFFLL